VSGWLVRNLRTVAIIGQYVRPEDLAVRHGGDEFAVVLEQRAAG
jgi:PleD family two-component response regulator